MADVLLVYPKVEEHDILYAPTALMCLAPVAEREFSVRILDTRLEDDPLSGAELRPVPCRGYGYVSVHWTALAAGEDDFVLAGVRR